MLAGYRQVYHEDSVQEAGDRQVALQAHWEEAQAKSDDRRAGEWTPLGGPARTWPTDQMFGLLVGRQGARGELVLLLLTVVSKFCCHMVDIRATYIIPLMMLCSSARFREPRFVGRRVLLLASHVMR